MDIYKQIPAYYIQCLHIMSVRKLLQTSERINFLDYPPHLFSFLTIKNKIVTRLIFKASQLTQSFYRLEKNLNELDKESNKQTPNFELKFAVCLINMNIV